MKKLTNEEKFYKLVNNILKYDYKVCLVRDGELSEVDIPLSSYGKTWLILHIDPSLELFIIDTIFYKLYFVAEEESLGNIDKIIHLIGKIGDIKLLEGICW